MTRPATWWCATARLASVLAGVGLATTRLGLVVHELLGHGGVAVALGGRVTDLQLFWFAGGWIRYEQPRPYAVSQHLAIVLGGIAVEFVIGLALWLALARRPSLGARIARACGGAIVMHAAWYLAIGTYHGFGDGAFVRHVAGDARLPIAIAAGLVMIVFAYLGARAILGALAATIPGDRRARVAGTAIALVIAGGLQGALVAGELSLRRDPTYGVVMQEERERVVARELARWERQQKLRGAEIDEATRRAREAALEEQHRELPFAYILGALALLAIAAGAWRARPGADTTIAPRLVVTAAAIAVGSVTLVIALDAAFA